MAELDTLRKKIDEIDLQILRLLNKRAGVVLEIKKTKKSKHLSIHSPVRERKIIERLTKLNPGPFPNEALQSLYREIISGSLFLQQSLKVAYLGPSGTFTHLAARRQFGSLADYVPEVTIKNVFESVISDRCLYGVVPVENSTEGIVNYTLDMFIDADLNIAFEILLRITHNLMSKTGRKTGIKKIYSHPQASAQCRDWLEKHYPGVPVVTGMTTAAAAKRVTRETSSAAIASELAAESYHLKVISKGIEDFKNNYTRFLVIAKDYLPKTGNDKTSVMFSVKDRPGALYSILKHFSKHRINLTKIESRPSRKKAWEYIFFVDMEGHIADRKVKKAVEEVRRECLSLKILGSYPSAE